MWLGSTAGQVASWSDTQVVATVAPTAVTGIARIQQNGVWSNALTFTVPASGGNAVTLSPNLLTMLVGDTHTIQALNSSGQPVTGLIWASSDPTVVSLSTSDPPLLTAVAVGHVTITAGAASADVMVSPGDPNYPGTLPLGTVLWSVPGSVTKIVPAVPSPSGVADVFAIQCDYSNSDVPCGGEVSVQAITSDGTTAWTATAELGYLFGEDPILADFLGGLVYIDGDTGSISRVDGTTGQISVLYTPPDGAFANMIAVHPDGTIFASIWDNDWSLDGLPPNSVIGFDPSGSVKFNVPVPVSGSASGLMIAGDGYAYVPYNYGGCGGPQIYLKLMRLTTAGTYDDMPIAVFNYPGWRVSPETCGQYGGDAPSPPQTYAITNADQGVTVVVGWMSQDPPIMAVTAGTSVSIVNAPFISNQQTMSVVQPVLQAQDGSYIGTIDIGWDQNNNTLSDMVSFDQTGAIRWMVPGNYQPQIATADGGLIATDPSGAAYTFDQNGNATGVLAGSPVQSWTEEIYTSAGGQVADVVLPPAEWASGYQSQAGGNPSSNGTAAGVFESVEGWAVFALHSWGPSCQLQTGSGGAHVFLGGDALGQYYIELQRVAGWELSQQLIMRKPPQQAP